MKIIDFDAKFFEYARKWVATHPGLNEDQIEQRYNSIMDEWINAPAEWLEGACPANYFDQFTRPQELIALLVGYNEQEINMPEPLYKRIVDMGEECAELLMQLLLDEARPEALRTEVMALLRDAELSCADEALQRMIVDAKERSELSDMASDILCERGEETASQLMDKFELAQPYGQDLILEICCNYPGVEHCLERLLHRLKNRPDEYARWAACLQKLGDPGALDVLMQIQELSELRYLDYLEVRAAIDALGGDPGEARDFYGDPDFEALRNL